MGTAFLHDKLAPALFGKTRRNVLAFLHSNANESFYLREIARATETSLGAVQRELKRLAEAGILRRSVRGNQVYYQADQACPIFAELQSLVIKTTGVADVLRAALGGLADRIQIAFLYGSIAKGSANAASDVDVLVIGKASFANVVAALAHAQEKLGRDVNPSVYPTREFLRKLREGHHFLTSVLRESKVFLVGDRYELERLAQGRLAHRAPDQQTRDRRFARGGGS